MDHFEFKQGQAYCEGLTLTDIGREFDTPTYVYSASTLDRHCLAFAKGFAAQRSSLCFAVKSNPNLSILRQIFAHGFGADIVSGGELERSLIAGAKPGGIVFSGVGKTEGEIRRALEVGIKCFHVESEFELIKINSIAKTMGKIAAVSLRVNPNIDARTNPKISTGLYETKFGIDEVTLERIVAHLAKFEAVSLRGIGCHIGSQITSLEPIKQACDRMVALYQNMRSNGVKLQSLGMGGGLGIRYKDETPPTIEDYAQAIISRLKGLDVELIVEPGRVIVGNCGVLLTKVLGLKKTPTKQFVIVDASMSELLRPALYNAHHEILQVIAGREPAGSRGELFDVVGPVCETTDILGRDRSFYGSPLDGDLLFIRSCGAYGMSMANNYNSRPRPAEVIVRDGKAQLVGRRETLKELWSREI